MPQLYTDTKEYQKLKRGRPVIWFPPREKSAVEGTLDPGQTAQASFRLQRFAPLISRLFPETLNAGGLVESPVLQAQAMQDILSDWHRTAILGNLFIKSDSHLPIAGSVKARGGLYAVLVLAERICMEADLLKRGDAYTVFLDDPIRRFLQKHTLMVGSTGNLGLAVGIMGSALGFKVEVHMSEEAKAWKKDLLRSRGAMVVERKGSYADAVQQARMLSAQHENCHFIDDEHSTDLFYGYSTAAAPLKSQLYDLGVTVDRNRPLFVYLPCGVGGAPGGITFGLKQQFGDSVHCFFAEPVQAPCMMLGMMSGKHDGIDVRDIGLSADTLADGLRVAKPSGFVGRAVGHLISGCYTVNDEALLLWTYLLHKSEKGKVEPSAAAGFGGPVLVGQSGYCASNGIDPNAVTHLVWTTGGRMMPNDEYAGILNQGQALTQLNLLHSL